MAPTTATNSPTKSTKSSYGTRRRSSSRIIPIIKIVHVDAPRLVRTDVANFRALVQEMTGNVAHATHNIKHKFNPDCLSSTNVSQNGEKSEAKTQDRLYALSRRENERGGHNEEEGCVCSESPGKAWEEEEGCVCVESFSKSWESSCACSVDSFLAEGEEACVEDHLYNMQQQYRSSFFAANWRPPLELPSMLEPFDYCQL